MIPLTVREVEELIAVRACRGPGGVTLFNSIELSHSGSQVQVGALIGVLLPLPLPTPPAPSRVRHQRDGMQVD